MVNSQLRFIFKYLLILKLQKFVADFSKGQCLRVSLSGHFQKWVKEGQNAADDGLQKNV